MIFKIKEVYLATGWTYITADSREDAERRLENGEGDFDADSAELQHKDTKYETLQEK